MQDLAGSRVLVTGANTGIGRVTARELAARGAHVLLATRSLERTREALDEIAALGRGSAEHLPLDLGDLASVQRAVRALRDRDEPLHVLLNNAGLVGSHGVTAQGFELAFGTNHLGHFLLTRGLLDLLARGAAERDAPSRVVNVASKAHVNAKRVDWEALRRPTATRTGWREYAVSKLCNIWHVSELARREAPRRVHAYALHPGVIASDLWRRVPWPIRAIATRGMISNEEGARTSIWCAAAPELSGETGRYYDDRRERTPTALARDATLARELWERSEAWVAPFAD